MRKGKLWRNEKGKIVTKLKKNRKKVSKERNKKMTSKLIERIDQLEAQLVQRDIDTINQAEAKLRAS